MSRRLTLDPSTFERLLAAALVLQHRHEQAACNHPPAPDEAQAELSEADVEPNCVSEHDAMSAPSVDLSKLGGGAEAAAMPDAALKLAAAWHPLIASVSRCAGHASQALGWAHSFASTVIGAARERQDVWTESACRYLGEAQSLWTSALRTAGQRLRSAARHGPLSGLPKVALAQSFRHAILSLLTVTDAAKAIPASFARYRVKACVTFNSKFTLSPRRALTKGATPLAVLLIMVAFTLTQVWPRGHFLTVAAVSSMDRPSQEYTYRKAAQFRLTAPDHGSHMQVTDGVVLSVVEALSRYEIPGLRRQADYGDDSAAFIMGMIYEIGHFVPQNCTKAATWVTSSANAGNAAAQYNLGLRYRDGDGVPANDHEAEKWLRRAADQRHSNARLALENLTSRDARSTYAPPGFADAVASGSASRR